MVEVKEINKANLIAACEQLIANYTKGYEGHKYSDCPLCQIYYGFATGKCSEHCPNSCFKGSKWGCIARNDNYPNIDWHYHESKLVVYWTKVKAYLEKQPEAELINLGNSRRIKERIMEIARDLNKA